MLQFTGDDVGRGEFAAAGAARYILECVPQQPVEILSCAAGEFPRSHTGIVAQSAIHRFVV